MFPSKLRSRVLGPALVVAALIAYGALLIESAPRTVGAHDTSGYANTARQILSGHLVSPVATLDRLGLPDTFEHALRADFVPGPRPRTMVPYYPAGFPLHVALAVLLAGWQVGPFVVSPLAAAACVLLMFLLGRELGLSRPLALAGAAILAACPVFLFQAVQVMSDVTATMWSLAAMLFALRARRQEWWAVAAGAALGMAVVVRPTNALLVLPLALALPWRPKVVVLVGLGALPAATFDLAWNHAAYGRYLGSGYSHQLGADWAIGNFRPRFRHYTFWISAQLSPLLLIGWLVAAANRRVPVRDRAVLVAWFAPFLLFYCCWVWYDTWWYTRFLLPALPALIVGFLLSARELSRLLAARPYLGPASLVASLAIVGASEARIGARFKPLAMRSRHDALVEASRFMTERARGAGVVVLAREAIGPLHFYTDASIVAGTDISADELELIVRRARERRYRVFTVLYPGELDQVRARLPGRWHFVRDMRGVLVWESSHEAGAPELAAPRSDACDEFEDGDDHRGFHTCYTDDSFSAESLQARNAACNPTDDSRWLACNDAIHRHCRGAGRWTTGLGPLEWGENGSATLACLTSDPPLEVSAAELARFGSCAAAPDGPPATRFECAKAVHGYCAAHGYATGFGPVGGAPPAWTIICLRAPQAVLVATTYAALAGYHGLCGGREAASATPTYCMSAAKGYCIDAGHVVGFGPVADPDGRSPLIVCLDD
jgi:hypothetical protein